MDRNLSVYRFGNVVVSKGSQPNLVGHIIGFGRNVNGELLIKVRWENGKETPIHPNNVEMAE